MQNDPFFGQKMAILVIVLDLNDEQQLSLCAGIMGNACRICRVRNLSFKVEKVLKGCLVLIPSPSPLVKIQILGGKVCLRCRGKILMGVVNKLLKTKSLLTSPCNVLPKLSHQ